MITVKTFYDKGESYVSFELSEYNSKIRQFLLSIGFEALDKFRYTVPSFKCVTVDNVEYRSVDIAAYQLNKQIKVLDGTRFNNLKQSKPYIKLEDGWLKLGYDKATASVILARMNGYDLSQVGHYLTDVGFINDKEQAHDGFRAFAAVCSISLLNRLRQDNYIRVHSDLVKFYCDLAVKRDALVTKYPAALRQVNKEWQGDMRPLIHQTTYLQKAVTTGSIMAFDMGCGKTFTSLYQATCYRKIYPDLTVVVVCPKSMCTQWEVTALDNFNIAVTAHTWSSIPVPLSKNYMVIFDECHYMADHENNRSRASLLLASQAIAVLCLSGTASKNGRAKELFNMLKCIDHETAVSKSEYNQLYGWDSFSTKMSTLAQSLSDRYFYVAKKDVLDLPNKVRTKHIVTMEPVKQAEYNDVFNNFMQRYYDRVLSGVIAGSERAEYLVALQGLRLALAQAKVHSCVKLCEQLVKLHHERVVIFSDFREPLSSIADELSNRNISYVVLNANDKSQDRYNKQKAFKEHSVQVFLSTYKCGGVGIDLTPCTQLILNDRPYTPGDVLQAEDRCHRIGQVSTLNVYWMWWRDPGETEERIQELLLSKQGNINELNNNQVSIDYD